MTANNAQPPTLNKRVDSVQPSEQETSATLDMLRFPCTITDSRDSDDITLMIILDNIGEFVAWIRVLNDKSAPTTRDTVYYQHQNGGPQLRLPVETINGEISAALLNAKKLLSEVEQEIFIALV